MPILDTIILFATADRREPNHEKAVSYMEKLREEDFYVANYALIEFDIVLKSRGFTPSKRMEIQALLLKNYPYVKTCPLTPSTLYLAAKVEKDYGLEYFDAGVAAEALQHDGIVVSTDNAFNRVEGIRRIW